ncbi:RNA methyltransferase, TrmH family [Proteiniborus sp. DW1]|uniref:TrmH family RNA methyltransferase n=1 Tax=Proteiniborus sp. DW1 TaxID=1889883 RepID=UPI00092E1E3C|nr:TrmH family RNA methyltransferase [Proteiniborus sp. DW1]SCG84058.1 RNA methyltransferase, TrmH family [Proteiniborus sp. DW1]
MDIQLKSYKKDFQYSYAIGVFPTLELLKYKKEEVLMVLLSSDGQENEGVKKIIDICNEHKIQVQINDKAINRISKKENSYAIGVFKKYEQRLEEQNNHVVLVNPSDMGNLGTIIRTILGFGIKNLAIIRPGVDIFDPKAIRASMGAVFRISFQYFEDFNNYQTTYSNDIYTFMLNAKKSLPEVEVNTSRPFSLVFGNEGSGLGDEFTDIGTSIIIPHSNEIDSLNLSIAVGIAAYEFTK